ncbi:MAG: hypothetical protein RID09_24790 [Coleofasciculus sp. G1-WW12-02]
MGRCLALTPTYESEVGDGFLIIYKLSSIKAKISSEIHLSKVESRYRQ